MDILQIATQLMTQVADDNNDGQVDINEAVGTLSRLFSEGGAGEAGSSLGLGGLVSKMQGSGLSDIVGSWLGDGENQAISGQQISDLFGSDKITEYASALNINTDSAQEQLAKVVPQMIDKSSSGGQLNDLLNAVGGLEGIGSMLFGKS